MIEGHTNPSRLRVANCIRCGFLCNTEQRQSDLGRYGLSVGSRGEIDTQAGSSGLLFEVRTQGYGEAGLIQEWRAQAQRQITNFIKYVIDNGNTVVDSGNTKPIGAAEKLHVDPQGREILSDFVMQLTSEMLTLLVADAD